MTDEIRFEHVRFDHEMGRTAPVRLLVHRTRKLAVIATSFIAYRSGFSFLLYTVQRNPPAYDPASRKLEPSVDYKTIAFVDASGRTLPLEPDFSGHSSRGWMECRYFVLELPSPGPITVSLDWPTRRSLRVSALLEASPILDAARKAEALW